MIHLVSFQIAIIMQILFTTRYKVFYYLLSIILFGIMFAQNDSLCFKFLLVLQHVSVFLHRLFKRYMITIRRVVHAPLLSYLCKGNIIFSWRIMHKHDSIIFHTIFNKAKNNKTVQLWKGYVLQFHFLQMGNCEGCMHKGEYCDRSQLELSSETMKSVA